MRATRWPVPDPNGGACRSVRAVAPELCAAPAPVVLAGWEDSGDEALRRRGRLALRGGCGWAHHASINARLHVLPMRGFGPLWAPAADGSRHIGSVGALSPSGTALLDYAERHSARLVVIDPAGLAIATNENDRALVSMALDALAGWALDTGCAVLITGHPAKARDGEAADYSGSTAWRGSVRALWTLRAPDEDKADRDSTEWARLVGSNPARAERVALLTRNKNNYGWDGDALTLATCGERAGWYLADPVPAPTGGTSKANGDHPGLYHRDSTVGVHVVLPDGGRRRGPQYDARLRRVLAATSYRQHRIYLAAVCLWDRHATVRRRLVQLTLPEISNRNPAGYVIGPDGKIATEKDGRPSKRATHPLAVQTGERVPNPAADDAYPWLEGADVILAAHHRVADTTKNRHNQRRRTLATLEDLRTQHTRTSTCRKTGETVTHVTRGPVLDFAARYRSGGVLTGAELAELADLPAGKRPPHAELEAVRLLPSAAHFAAYEARQDKVRKQRR